MSSPYQEIIGGAAILRKAPGRRHETICARLHQYTRAGVANFQGTRLLAPRTIITVGEGTRICPDLALVATANDKPWLVAEIVSADDHQIDTVTKKQLYEDIHLPRLWMVDPRYDNVEVYHGTQYGLSLKAILAGRELLTEKLLPEFQIAISVLFAEEPPLDPLTNP